MYFYYGCACIGIKPFANVVTELQLTQFVTMMAQALFILGFDCAYPHRVTGFYLGYILSRSCRRACAREFTCCPRVFFYRVG